ncbi:MAG: hypothetical protein U0271_08040 [Polyangiaceae bacterium]
MDVDTEASDAVCVGVREDLAELEQSERGLLERERLARAQEVRLFEGSEEVHPA